VIVNGRYQELPEPQYASECAHARKLLEKRYQWWLNALAERHMEEKDNMITSLFFPIHINSMAGLRASAGGPARSENQAV
jgi:nitroimidazol reductase NimA-like FMN-containing flavoprotein (pyridoxamine 5'-phosphate oxidase superfamily)